MTNDNSSPETRPNKGRNAANNTSMKKLSCSNAFTCKFESHECCSPTEMAPCLINCSNKIDIFIGKIVCTVRMFHHRDVLLSPQACRIVQHRDGTRRGNSTFLFHFAFRIGSCVFSFGAHISSWSGTRDTTLIRGLNHG